jgi:SpoVK/Ycf46/Vps4 family AAA+-type ATPase
LLKIDPSHLVREGMDRIQAEANTLFEMLSVVERIVVLFDEFDEMVRDRSSPSSEANSRFLTTAMLPKLTSIHDNRKIVFILATNYIGQFDFAVTRLGRFDKRFQILPPTSAAKLRSEEFEVLARSLAKVDRAHQESLKEQISLLTYSECHELNEKLKSPGTPDAIIRAIEAAARNCTLSQRPAEPQTISTTTWLEQSREQALYTRF